MDYEQPLFRPPSEAESLIFQVTSGCSHNRCHFCSMYRTKSFTAKPADAVGHEIDAARDQLGPSVKRVFLADGDALCLSQTRLVEILDRLNAAFPRLQRISIYANARDVLKRSDADLAALRQRKLRVLYTGLESGDDETLARVEKGATAAEIVSAVQRAQQAGMTVSVMVLIGLAGRARSLIHARASATAINEMAPRHTSLLTYTPTPATPLHRAVAEGTFELPNPQETIREIYAFVEGLTCQTQFWCNHASNYLALQGRLPQARDALLTELQAALDEQIPLRPEFLRGL